MRIELQADEENPHKNYTITSIGAKIVVFLHDPPLPPYTPRGLSNLMAIAFSPRCFATKKNVLTGCLNGISVSCFPGNEPGAL